MTAEKLEEAIRVVTSDDGMKTRAQAMGEKIRQEDGVREAVSVINTFGNGKCRKHFPF